MPSWSDDDGQDGHGGRGGGVFDNGDGDEGDSRDLKNGVDERVYSMRNTHYCANGFHPW